MRVVLLNGPPRAGKDHTGGLIVDRLVRRHGMAPHQVQVHKFAKILKERTHAAYGMSAPWDAFEDCKDVPLASFLGLTPRDAYIAFSERYMKPLHGEDVFGRFLASELSLAAQGGRPLETAVITDSGFRPEAAALLHELCIDPADVLLVRVHDPRRRYAIGECFDGDSRSFIDIPGVATTDLVNDRSARYEAAVDEIVECLVPAARRRMPAPS